MGLIIILVIVCAFILFNYKKMPILGKPGIYIFAPACLFSPLAFYYILFGLSGSNNSDFLWMAVGYICTLVFSFISLKNFKCIVGAVVGLILIAFGGYSNSQFWKIQNSNLCAQLRGDPFCVESKTGFYCSEKSSVHAFSSANVCENRLSELELIKINTEKRNLYVTAATAKGQQPDKKIPNLQHVSAANKVYHSIVEKIISSADPSQLNFEEQLIAIYNCINDEFEDQLKAEAYATQTLQSLAKTKEQIDRYRSYSASKGRNINSVMHLAALPAGNKKFNCAFLIRLN